MVFGVILVEVVQVTRWGGHPYFHGDWLISNIGGTVRRGISGDIVFWISEVASVKPIWVITTIQLSIAVVVIWTLTLTVMRYGVSDRLLIIVLSPAVVPFFGTASFDAIRKEFLFYLALTPMLVPSRSPKALIAIYVLTTLLFGIATFVHEMNAVLLPFFLTALFLKFRTVFGYKTLAALALLPAGIALAAVIYALHFSTAPDLALICSEITTRQMSENLCTGTIAWLDRPLEQQMAITFDRHISVIGLTNSLLIYSTAAVPFVMCLSVINGPFRASLTVFGSALVLLPLYLVAIDWGRWMSVHLTSLCFLILIYVGTSSTSQFRSPVRPQIKWMAIAAAFLIGLNHISISVESNLITSAIDNSTTILEKLL